MFCLYLAQELFIVVKWQSVYVSIEYKCPYMDAAWVWVRNYGATNVAPTQKDKHLLSSKTRPHFQTHKWFWKEHKLGHGSEWGSKPSMTVLARASSKLLDRTGLTTSSKSLHDRLSFGQSVLVSSPISVLLSDSCGFVEVRHPLWREDESVIYHGPSQQYMLIFFVTFNTIFIMATILSSSDLVPLNPDITCWTTVATTDLVLIGCASREAGQSFLPLWQVRPGQPGADEAAVVAVCYRVALPRRKVQGWGVMARVRVRFTLRLAVYRQSVRLGAKPLEAHDHSFFSIEPLRL
jgi:hypothetical protein